MELIKETIYDEKIYKYTNDDNFTSLLTQMIQLGYVLQQNYRYYEDNDHIYHRAIFIKTMPKKVDDSDG